jgi:penicillin-binding protein 1A
LSDWFFRRGKRENIDWLSLDSWIDSSLAESWSRIKDYWNAGSSFFARFRLTGWRRLLNEAASEGFTLGLGGIFVLFALALPAFMEFDEGRFLTGRYSVKFLDPSGNEIGQRGILHNDAVPLEEIPDAVVKATLATEDRRFFEHFGVDFLGTFRALVENLRANDVVQGGSSLTQQLAKNLFLSSERSLDRKVKEVFLAFLLEARFSKRDILKLYLDRAYLGGGAFGVDAASQYYFGKSVKEVNLAEAAMLAGLYKAPSKYNPNVNMPASRARTNEVLQNLVEAGFYTQAQVHEARLHPAKIVETRATTSPDWFLDWAFEEVQRIAEGKNQYVLTARTTVDIPMQRQADEALVSFLKQKGRGLRINSGALVAMETDGAVRAMVGGPDYGESQFNRATHAKRQPGSSFKVYVYATALENGYRPDTQVRDASRSCGNWHPQNFGGSHGGGGRMPLWMALAKSLNTVAAELSFAVGREKVIEMTKRLGISGIRKSCSMALGDYGITPLEHTGGVATFANGGKSAKPYAVLELFNSKGELVYSRERDEPEPAQLVSRQVAEGMNQMMQKVVTDGTAQLAALDFTNVAGKTGTSTGPTDNWFVGFTGKYVGGVWLGNDDNRPMASGNTGGHMAAPLWHSFMSVAHKDMNIPTIPGLQPHPVQVAEQQRIAELKRTDPAAAAALAGAEQGQKTSPIMPEPTKDTLKRISGALRKAAGMEDAPPEKPAASPTQNGPDQPPKPPGNKADAGPMINGSTRPKPVAGVASAGLDSGEPQ